MDLAITIILWTAATLCVVVGAVGLLLPVLPGPLILFVGLLLGAWAEGFRHVGPLPLMLLAAMMTGAMIVDQVASAFGVRRVGASRAAAVGALIGAVLGIFAGLPGILLGPFVGPFVGAFFGELYAKNRLDSAGRAGLGAWMGFFLGTVAKVAIGVTMIGTFILFRLF